MTRLAGCGVCLIGPGLGRSEGVTELVQGALAASRGSVTTGTYRCGMPL